MSEKEPTFMSDRKGHNGITEDGTATTLTSQDKERPVVGTSTVRRLTCVECERLQGLPDNWTLVGTRNDKGEYIWLDENGKSHKSTDSARYRAIGNGIALPFWTWLVKRISAQYERSATLGSLFDGTGSFPLIWQRVNGNKTARWASEIEPYCIAMTKQHFGNEDDGTEGDWRNYL